jgi:hypothetical protein
MAAASVCLKITDSDAEKKFNLWLSLHCFEIVVSKICLLVHSFSRGMEAD